MIKHRIKAMELHEPRIRRVDGADQEPDPLGKTVYPGEKGCALPAHLCINLFTSDRFAQLKTLPQTAIRYGKREKKVDPNSPPGRGWFPSDVVLEELGVGVPTLNKITESLSPTKDDMEKYRDKRWYSPDFLGRIRAVAPPKGSVSTYKLFENITWRGINTVAKMLMDLGIRPAWELGGIRYYHPEAVERFREAYPDSILKEAKIPS